MALPDRKYYTLQKASAVIRCDIEDLLHFSAIGLLQICFPIPPAGMFNITDEGLIENVSIKILRNNIDNTSTGEEIYRFRTSYTILQEQINSENKTTDFHISGLLAITLTDIHEFYDSYLQTSYNSDTIYINNADFPRDFINPFKTVGYNPFNIEFSNPFLININQLVITNHELALLQSGGKIYSNEDDAYINENELEHFNKTKIIKRNDRENSAKTANLQLEFIRNLLHIKYGQEAIENPRNFVDRKASEIAKDFELIGAKCPTGKAIENWLKK